MDLQGTLFQNGLFKGTIIVTIKYAENPDWEALLNSIGYSTLFQIGTTEEIEIMVCFSDDSNDYPRYMIEIRDIDGIHERYFINYFVDFNIFLKEINPLIEIAKHVDQREKNK